MMVRPSRLLSAVALSVVFANVAHAAAPVVPGFERVGPSDAAKGGRLLVNELNCVLCHTGESAFAPKQGPNLDQVGSRVRVGYLKKFLADPLAVKPGTTMPHLFADDANRAEKIEALVHFLASTGTPKQERADAKSVKSGHDLYHKIGCVACHGTRNANASPDKTTASTVPLVDLKSKYSIASLAAFLEDPRHARPSGRMPALILDGKDKAKEAKEIANFLLAGIKVNLPVGKGTTKFSYYEGDWDKLPDFATQKVRDTGVGAAFDLGVAKRKSNYALVFEGVFRVEKEGQYKFYLMSDDGSQLWIDGKMVVNNDGIHQPTTVTGSTRLAKGEHIVRVPFFQGGGGDELALDIEGSGLVRQPLANFTAVDSTALAKALAPALPKDDEDHIEIDAERVKQGRTLFASAGCANCHTVKGLKSALVAPALAKLPGVGGCLSATPAKGLPMYDLSDAQRAAIGKALTTPAAPAKDPIAQTFLAFNCYACHSRDKVGGPDDALNKFFHTTQPEMGDEARLPPPLDGVGAKIKPDYLKQILDKGTHDRPYMSTRMPGFGIQNVAAVHAAFLEADKGKFPAVAEVTFADSVAKVKSAGRHIIGGQAFGCIKCHTFSGNKAEGVQGIDMVLMPQRLTRDWFHAYLADPQKIRPGTRMPTIYDKGKSPLSGILDGVPSLQSEAIWTYLVDGKKAQLPVGVKKESIPLVAFGSAVVYRNFIEGAGARAIGVGFPEKANVAFDANEMRLAMVWHGAFIDAGRHWNGRGVGYEPPLGDNVLSLPPGSTFAYLAKADEAWPATPAKAQGFRFAGYDLTPDERPTFRYSLGDVKFEDFPNAVTVGKDAAIRRTLNVAAPKDVGNLYFRAAIGNKIEAKDAGVFRIDGQVTMKLTGQGAPLLRNAGGRMELLVPVVFVNGKARIVQEIAW